MSTKPASKKPASSKITKEEYILGNLMKSKGITKALFEIEGEPSGDLVLEIHDRIFGDLDDDEPEHNETMGQLATSLEEAKKIFAKPEPLFVLGIYDRLFTDMLDE